MFENAFKYVDDILRKDSGCSTALDYVEQSSWVLFLKYLDDLESERRLAATLKAQDYAPIISAAFQWDAWAAPKNAAGEIDHNLALTGPDLLEFVNGQLWPYLASFKNTSTDPETLDYKIGEIFSEVRNKLQSGYNLREIVNRFDTLKFESAENKHEMSSLYEDKIKGMGNAGRNGGEYYTPRPLIRAMVKITNPKVGETVYDPACGSAGFLVEAFHHMWKAKLTTAELEFLQKKTFLGKEVKSLAYIVGTMNMILHGIEAPRIIHANTLGENVMQIQEKDRFDVILANPPFGGSERPEVQQNFPIRSGETAYLFLQHFIRSLKTGGRAAIVIKNTFLSNADASALRKELLETCDVHTVLDCPPGTFTGTGVKTVVLFFKKGKSTNSTWFYQLTPGRTLGKTNPLNDQDLAEFVALQSNSSETENSWNVRISDINAETFDLSVKNPNRIEVSDSRSPSEIMTRIQALEGEVAQLIENLGNLSNIASNFLAAWPTAKLGDVCDVKRGSVITRKDTVPGTVPVIAGGLGPAYFHSTPNREAGVITVSGSGANAGAVAAWDVPIWASDCTTVESKKSDLLQRYVYLFLKAKESFIKKELRQGAAQPHVYPKDISLIEIPLPSIDEQEQIIEILNALEVNFANQQSLAKRQAAEFAALRAAFLRESFHGAE